MQAARLRPLASAAALAAALLACGPGEAPPAPRAEPAGRATPAPAETAAPERAAAAAPAAPADGPNVVVVTLDTLRADHVSAYGYPRATTPNLDALAAEGALLEQAYAVSSTTLPSHATLFTGLYPSEHGVLKNALELPADVPKLASRLRTAGYETAAFVSSFVVDARFGLDRGFDVYDDDFRGQDYSSPIEEYEGHVLEAPYDRRGHETTERVLRWLEERDPGRPFFLWVHYFDPHSPYDPPQRWREDFVTTEDEHSPRHAIDLYDGDVRAVDAELGRLVEALDRHAPPEETFLTVTADHGEGLWDHGYMEHGVFLYEGMVRVPWIVRWPGHVPAGRRVPGLAHHVDLVPTLAALTGLPVAEGPARGRDLAPQLRGEAEPDPERTVFLQRRYYEPGRRHHVRVAGIKYAVRRGHWKLIFSPEEVGMELYDLARDPGERRNLAGLRRDVAGTLFQRMQAWRQAQAERAPARAVADEDVRRKLEALGYVE